MEACTVPCPPTERLPKGDMLHISEHMAAPLPRLMISNSIVAPILYQGLTTPSALKCRIINPRKRAAVLGMHATDTNGFSCLRVPFPHPNRISGCPISTQRLTKA